MRQSIERESAVRPGDFYPKWVVRGVNGMDAPSPHRRPTRFGDCWPSLDWLSLRGSGTLPGRCHSWSRTRPMNCQAHCVFSCSGCWNSWRSWTVKPTKLAPRSRRGTGIASQAENSLKFQESDRLPPGRWWRPSSALGTSPAVANWRRGSVLCLDKAPVEGRTSYSASASGETRICERCSSMALARW